jgi:hypothetical protein
VLYTVATPVAMREAMVRAFEYAKSRCHAPDDIEWIDNETGEIHTRQLRIVIGPDVDALTVKQRGFYHAAVIKQITEQARDEDGRAYDFKVWKEHLRKKFLGANGLRWETYRAPGEKRARPHAVRISTENLSVKQYSELIDKVIAYATTELNVEFVFDHQEREAVRWKRKPRKVAAPSPTQEEEAVPA